MLGINGRTEWGIEIDDSLSDFDDAKISTRRQAKAFGSEIKRLLGG